MVPTHCTISGTLMPEIEMASLSDKGQSNGAIEVIRTSFIEHSLAPSEAIRRTYHCINNVVVHK